jgi:hypothetical protein
MNDWTEERIRQQRDLAVAGGAGFWMLLEGGPRDGTRGFVPHLDWPFFVVLDREGAVWSFANPPGKMRLPPGARIVGAYLFEREREIMTWQATDGAPLDVPSMPRR